MAADLPDAALPAAADYIHYVADDIAWPAAADASLLDRLARLGDALATYGARPDPDEWEDDQPDSDCHCGHPDCGAC